MCLLVQSLSILDLSVSTARQLLDQVDCLLISPHSTTLKSHVKVMRITDMITNIKELLIVAHIFLVSTVGNVKRILILKLG